MATDLTPEQVAEQLQITPDAIRRWLIAGKLPGLKIGNKWRVDAQDFELWRRQHRKRTTFMLGALDLVRHLLGAPA
jgi:excisionase family DNA binding protein